MRVPCHFCVAHGGSIKANTFKNEINARIGESLFQRLLWFSRSSYAQLSKSFSLVFYTLVVLAVYYILICYMLGLCHRVCHIKCVCMWTTCGHNYLKETQFTSIPPWMESLEHREWEDIFDRHFGETKTSDMQLCYEAIWVSKNFWMDLRF